MGTLEIVSRRGDLQDSIDRALRQLTLFESAINANAEAAPDFAAHQRRLAQQVKGYLIQAAARSYSAPAQGGQINK